MESQEVPGAQVPSKKDITSYFARRAVEALPFPLMKANKAQGLFPKTEGWRNVVEHELVESEAVDVLAEMLGVSSEDREKLRTAALLHDVFKRKEQGIADAKGAQGFDESATAQSEWLASLNYPPDIVGLTESVGHTSLQHFTDDYDSIPTINKIMHYIDDITSTISVDGRRRSDLVPLDQRMDALEANPKYTELSESGRAVFSGRTFMQVQREVSKRIERDFVEALGIAEPEQLPIIIRQAILRRVVDFKNTKINETDR